jgi:hypothetical protein
VMTESEWLASADPAAMLADITTHAGEAGQALRRKASDRKLRLFAQALMWTEGVGPSHDGLPADPGRWLAAYFAQSGPGVSPAPANAAALLREVIGNPFRPVTPFRVVQKSEPAENAMFGRLEIQSPPWLTPQVLSLAQAASAARRRRVCGRCKGAGGVLGEGEYGVEMQSCPAGCNKGRVEDGTLDPFRLALVADALLDAGCDSEDLLRHLRGEEGRCRACGNTGYVDNGDSQPHPCAICPPAQGPHVRGCFALDLILGKE